MNIPSTVFVYFYFFAHTFYSVGQNTLQHSRIRLTNPSFEGSPMQSAVPAGWKSIDFQGESAPDVHPNGFWGVTIKPFSGKTYLGLVARANKTWERIGQVLSSNFFDSILLEAYYADEIKVNGHLLCDEASDIIPISCSYDK